MKEVKCKHCLAINMHHSFQCHTQRKPIKKTPTPIGDYTMTKKSAPIPKFSSKEKKRQVAYNALRKEFMKQFPMCQAHLHYCTYEATDIHHLYSGSDRSKYFLDTREWKAVCRNCHTYIHTRMSTKELIELGLRKIE